MTNKPSTPANQDKDYMGTPQPGRHSDRVAIITGASRGIGRFVARRLAAEGATVVVAAKSLEPHPKLPGTIIDCVEEIEAAGGKASYFQLDVRDDDQVAAMIADTVERYGKIDYLFNNAGAIFLGPVTHVPAKRFDLMFDVNVRGAHVTAFHALPHMIKQGFGRIINFSPPLHLDPSPGMGPYMVTKLGMTRIAMAIAAENGSDGVAASTIWPVTMIDTAAVRVNQMGDESQYRTPEIISDAMSELLSLPHDKCNGRQFTDEELLLNAGLTETDLERYWVLGKAPEHVMSIVGEGAVMR